MDRRDLVRLVVWNEISSDYENIDQIILPEAIAVGARCGWTIERAEVVEALAGLIEDGLAKAYILSQQPARELPGMPSVDVPEENFGTYFYITAKGRAAIQDTKWPFDDDGNPRLEPTS